MSVSSLEMWHDAYDDAIDPDHEFAPAAVRLADAAVSQMPENLSNAPGRAIPVSVEGEIWRCLYGSGVAASVAREV